tara:strand:- start:248 stop:1222 length:975 start_codon:yes stop_codon:yes gene_type:complete
MARQKFPKPHIYIFNSGACHGHYLTYLIDRLSEKTPAIKQLPFNKFGNSHIDVDYSGFSHFVDSPVHNQYKTLKNQNIIKILYGNDILYHERAAMARGGDGFADVYTAHNDISFLKKYNNEFYEKIRVLYSINNDSVPKWLLRDAYKMGFLDWKKQGSVVTAKQDVKWIEENLGEDNKIHYTEVNVFFTAKTLIAELQSLDKAFDLNLDFSEFASIHEEFLARNKIFQTHEYTEIVLDAIQNKQDITIPPLDIIQQAYVYAQLEKKYDFVIMPMTEDFFKTTKEVTDYITLYPQHYKAMNPNLPKFNNIDNPFFLHRQKNKSVL